MKNRELAVLGLLTLAATLVGVNEILALFAGGLLGLAWHLIRNPDNSLRSFTPLLLLQVIATPGIRSSWWLHSTRWCLKCGDRK